MRALLLFVITILVFQVSLVHAIDPAKPISLYERSLYTLDNGLPTNTVYDIIQTPDSYLWFATLQGLVRFDGIEFDLFNSENTSAFTTDAVTSIALDNSDGLWISTLGGGVVRYEKGIFTTLSTVNGLLHNESNAIIVSRDNTVWIGTALGLNHYDNGTVTAIPTPKTFQETRISALLEDSKGRIWAGTHGGGIFIVTLKGKSIEVEVPQHINAKTIFAMTEDRKGRIWIATLAKGLIRLHGKKQFVYDKTNGLPVNYVHALHLDPAGNLLIGTYGGGLSVLPAGEEKLVNLDDYRVPGCNSVMALFEDREQNIWKATDTSGIIRLRDTRITTYTSENGLTTNSVFGAFQDSDGNIWTGTIGFGYLRMNPKQSTPSFKVFTEKEGISSNSSSSIAEYPIGTLWFGTLGGGITRYNMKTGETKTFTIQDGLLNDFVFALYVDPDNTLWAGTNYGGLHRYINDKFQMVHNVKRRIVAIHRDKQENMWVCTSGNGLWRIKDNKKTRYGKKEGFKDERVVSVFQDSQQRMWFGTLVGGLMLYNPKDESFRHMGKKEGLPLIAVYGIIDDNKHHLWLSTDNGVMCLFANDIRDFLSGKNAVLNPYRLDVAHGMKSKDCNGGNQPSICRSNDGRIWIPTNSGLSVLDPDNIGKNRVPPPVRIKHVEADKKTYCAWRGEAMMVPPGKGDLEIHYTAPSMISPHKITFKYKLEGVNEDWVDAGKRRTAFYTFLPPGDYTFKVIACNSDGIWNTKGASFKIHLEPHYYQTMVFKAAMIITLLTLALLGYHTADKYFTLRKQKRTLNGKKIDLKEQQEYLRKLLYLVEVEKIYRDPNISLKKLSSKLIVSARTISYIINDQLKKTFFEFINHYRIKEAQDILINPGKESMSVIDIGFEVGFNSKSSFNRVFKNITNTTPSQFRKKNGRPNS